MQTGYTQHVPVMLEEVLKFLQPRAGGHYVDGTLGGGGHTQAILERSAPDGKVLGIDTDAQAIARIKERLSDFVNNGRLVLVHGNFAELVRIVHEAGFVSVEGVLLDLGFSSYQVDDPQRGFSFSADGPMDMRLDQSQAESAAGIVNSAPSNTGRVKHEQSSACRRAGGAERMGWKNGDDRISFVGGPFN